MSKNIAYFNIKHWLSVISMILFLLEKFFSYEVSGKIIESNHLNNTLSVNETLCNINNYSYVRDDSSWWNWTAIIFFSLALLLATLNNYLNEAKEYAHFQAMLKPKEEKKGLAAIKNQIKEDFQDLSVNINNPNDLKEFLKENSITLAKLTENNMLATSFNEQYKKEANTIIERFSTFWIQKYKPISHSLYTLSFLLNLLIAVETRLNWFPYLSLSLAFVSLFTQGHAYHNLHKPTKALSKHIVELKQIDVAMKKEIASLLYEKSQDLYEKADKSQIKADYATQHLNILSQKLYALHAGLFRAAKDETEQKEAECENQYITTLV